jgi:RNA-directed DNA polymerase
MKTEISASPEEQVSKFYNLSTINDVADLLEVNFPTFLYYLYKIPEMGKYRTFPILKNGKGARIISTPIYPLKIIQRKCCEILQNVYKNDIRYSTHGFVRERSILTNAKNHVGKKYVFNIDLKDFFSSIHFGRVKGLLSSYPFDLPENIAGVIGNICCYKNVLPQGAPTSPIISNMICYKMDIQLELLAKRNKCEYSRYADDITFSTSQHKFPTEIAIAHFDEFVHLGDEISRIIENNGFQINFNKVRLLTRHDRQVVTGLTVNQFPNVSRTYISRIRAMLHAWEKYGLENAQADFINRYDTKHRPYFKKTPLFANVVKSKINFLGMVRGKDDKLYKRFRNKLLELDPGVSEGKRLPELIIEQPPIPTQQPLHKAMIFTEGKTDWKHLKAALNSLRGEGLYRNISFEFDEFEDARGDDALFNMLNICYRVNRNYPMIFLFDRDNNKTLDKIRKNCLADKTHYQEWGNNVFSLVLPLPAHRVDNECISIEFYYTDEEIKREDSSGRRLYLSNEFTLKSGRLKNNPLINCTDINKYNKPHIVCIVDDKVYNEEEANIALSKENFVLNILRKEGNFKKTDFSQFHRIFDIIAEITQEYIPLEKIRQ